MDARVRSRGGTLAVAGLDDTPHDKNETCGVEAGESIDMGVYIASVWLGRWFSPRRSRSGGGLDCEMEPVFRFWGV